jgi:hypothetical protein
MAGRQRVVLECLPTASQSKAGNDSSRLDPAGEGTILTLTVPRRDPFIWADCREIFLEIIAWCIFVALDLLATIVVNIVLPAGPKENRWKEF